MTPREAAEIEERLGPVVSGGPFRPKLAPPSPEEPSRREREAAEIADRLIEDLAGYGGTGGCICDDQTGDARALIVKAIEDAMAKECEAT